MWLATFGDFKHFSIAAAPETVHLYQYLLHEAVLGLQSPYLLQNFDDPENVHRIIPVMKSICHKYWVWIA